MSSRKTAPIYERYQEVLAERERDRERIRGEVKAEYEEKHPEDCNFDFQPSLDLSQTAVTGRGGRRNVKQFIDDVQEWDDNKKRNRQILFQAARAKDHMHPYQPNINKKTQKLFEVFHGGATG